MHFFADIVTHLMSPDHFYLPALIISSVAFQIAFESDKWNLIRLANFVIDETIEL